MTAVSRGSATALPASPPTKALVPGPNDPAGEGRGSAIVLGATAGTALGMAAGAGMSALARRTGSPALQYGAFALGAAAMATGGYFGYKLGNDLSRSTYAETTREVDAKRTDLEIQSRVLAAQAEGRLTGAQGDRIAKLRTERLSVAVSRPQPTGFGAAIPALGFVAGGMAPALLPRSLNLSGFALMGMLPVGAALGAWAGSEVARTWFNGEHHAVLPAEAAARVSAIDAELDELLAAAS